MWPLALRQGFENDAQSRLGNGQRWISYNLVSEEADVGAASQRTVNGPDIDRRQAMLTSTARSIALHEAAGVLNRPKVRPGRGGSEDHRNSEKRLGIPS